MVNFYGKSFPSRLLIGTALYPSPAIMQAAIRASGSSIVTVSLRRETAGFWWLTPFIAKASSNHQNSRAFPDLTFVPYKEELCSESFRVSSSWP